MNNTFNLDLVKIEFTLVLMDVISIRESEAIDYQFY